MTKASYSTEPYGLFTDKAKLKAICEKHKVSKLSVVDKKFHHETDYLIKDDSNLIMLIMVTEFKLKQDRHGWYNCNAPNLVANKLKRLLGNEVYLVGVRIEDFGWGVRDEVLETAIPQYPIE